MAQKTKFTSLSAVNFFNDQSGAYLFGNKDPITKLKRDNEGHGGRAYFNYIESHLELFYFVLISEFQRCVTSKNLGKDRHAALEANVRNTRWR